MNTSEHKFNISEIFFSIQGEGSRAGLPCVFIRLQGCNMRCSWCDTPYGLEVGQIENLMTAQEIINEVKKYNCNFIEFTGGEPLMQSEIVDVINYFCDNNYEVAIETNGYYPYDSISDKAIKIMDLKCPSSLMEKLNNYSNLTKLNKTDEVKFVIGDENDFDWAIQTCEFYDLFNQVDTILFSPVFNIMQPIDLANKILASGKKIRMQLQLHKYIWDPNMRGV
jgi:7-carboxy-7-deazaguanine synthase